MEGFCVINRPEAKQQQEERPWKKQKGSGDVLEVSKPVVLPGDAPLVLCGEYVIPRSRLSPRFQKEQWFKSLTVVPKGMVIAGQKPEAFPMFTLTDTRLHVPRFLGLQWFADVVVAVEDHRTLGDTWPASVQFKGTLSSSPEKPQRVAHDRCVTQLRTLGGALLVLPCGFGKTVVSLAVAATLRQKCLVLVTTVELARQWQDRVQEFLGCSVGKIQQAVCDIDHPVVIGLLQTVRSRQPDLKSFGTCIVDEAHHVAAQAFSQVMPFIPCRYVLGLSATPNRKDGLKKVLLWLLGPVAFSTGRKENMVINVMRCVVTGGSNKVLTYKNGEVARSKMITWLTEDDRRNRLIVHLMRVLLNKNPLRKVLVLTDRREHAQLLQSSWPENSGLMLGGMKEADIEVNKQLPVLISTYHYCSEGFDLPRLDTLFLVTPRSDIEQSVGRVLRKHVDKQTPLIVDFVDNFSVFEGQSEKRVKYFDKLGCTVKTYDEPQLLSLV